MSSFWFIQGRKEENISLAVVSDVALNRTSIASVEPTLEAVTSSELVVMTVFSPEI